MGYTAPRTVYRAFSLVFRVPQIRQQLAEVRKLIYLVYTAAIAVRALDAISKAMALGNPYLIPLLILIGTGITMGVTLFSFAPNTTPTEKEQFIQREVLTE